MKKKNCIVLGGTANHAFAVACVLMDLKKYCSDWLEQVVYFHDGLDEEQQKLLNKIFPTKCVQYEFPISDISVFWGNPAFAYFSRMVFCKYECFKLLDDYSCVIWLDYDIVIKQDLRELVDYCESGIKFSGRQGKVESQFFMPIDEYDMKYPVSVSGCIFALQEHLGDYLAMRDYCYEFIKKYGKILKNGEQGAFDCLIQKSQLNVHILDPKAFSLHPNNPEGHSAAKIIHAYGQPKFWNGLENEQWNSNYETWINMGGQRKSETISFYEERDFRIYQISNNKVVLNSDILKDKIVIFGTGDQGSNVNKLLKVHGINACYWVDNNKTLQGNFKDGLEIISLEKSLTIPDIKYIIAVFSPKVLTEIFNQLREANIAEENLLSVFIL